ncbi:MAG: hypothetical protein SOW59_00945 [Corynebacterium sp.]|nr:hypothetical protein [Corynebacterium sp.]
MPLSPLLLPTASSTSAGANPRVHSGHLRFFAIAMVLALTFSLFSTVGITPAHAVNAPDRTQITVLHPIAGEDSTPNSRQPRPALSLSKLYLGYWVLRSGAPEDRAQVTHMLRFSDDNIASRLDARYPQAIDDIAREFGLASTRRNGYWGNSATSSYDVARFLQAIYGRPDAAPLFEGMRGVAPRAADGYPQNFGTSHLPGIRGTKFGWADNGGIHASASYSAEGVFVAAITFGSAAAHTEDIVNNVRLNPVIPGLGVPANPNQSAPPAQRAPRIVIPAVPGVPGSSQSREIPLPQMPPLPQIPSIPQSSQL